MHNAHFDVTGSNYRIRSQSIFVSDMAAERVKIKGFVDNKGGSCRRHEEWEAKRQRCFIDGRDGHYRISCFSDEFFLDGILITLHGVGSIQDKCFVNALQRELCREGKMLATYSDYTFSDYVEYHRMMDRGLVEQAPSLTDSGMLDLTLEGAARHLRQERPDFYALTGLPKKTWPLPLMLQK